MSGSCKIFQKVLKNNQNFTYFFYNFNSLIFLFDPILLKYFLIFNYIILELKLSMCIKLYSYFNNLKLEIDFFMNFN
jgi:hypothetical protein